MRVCASCGREVEGDFAFCPHCGAELAAAARQEQRKTVTVLFCDVTGSTSLGESVDPEALRGLLAHYFERMKAIIERHGGTVEKFIGDAVMAVFGVPVSHEDDALRAVRAAAEMRDALPELGVQCRIGLTTGEVVTGTEERLVTGDAVNVAARLEQAARPGEVLIGAPTYALVGDAAEVEPVEPLELKGKAAPVPAYRLLHVREAPERRHEARFVGRERELATLRGAWTRAQAEQRCELVTVVGDAGVGKSRLVSELLASIETTVVRGRCLPYGEGITYWPVVEVLKQLDLLPEDEAATGAIRSLLGETEAATSAEEIAWAFRKTLEQAARERPLAVVFEDIQWGEETFLNLIEHVALLSSGGSILLLAITRPELTERRPTWPVTLRLEPLSEENVEELIPERISGELRERIARSAGGNPLFIEEMLAMTQEAEGDVSVPPTLQALLATRLDQLETGERSVLERGAIEGEVFHRGALQALAPEETQVTPRLAALVRKELISPDKTQLAGEDGFRFRHLLVRDAAYDALPKAVRAELHERFASWLEQHGAELVELDEILGYHLEQAYRYRIELAPEDAAARVLAERAAERLAAAGRRALPRGDGPAGVNLLSRAAELLPKNDARQPALLIDLGSLQRELGELERAEAVLLEAADTARSSGERALELRATLAYTHLRLLLDETALETFKRTAEQAIGELEQLGDEAALAQGWSSIAQVHLMELKGGAMADALELAMKHAQRAGDRGLEVESLVWLLRNCWFGPRPVDDGIRLCAEVLEQRSGEPFVESVAIQVLGLLHGMRGEFERARELLDRAREIQLDLRMMIAFGAGTTTMGAVVEMLAGDPVAAERWLREGYEILAPIGEKGYLSTLVGYLAEALYEQGRYDEAEEATQEAKELSAPEDVESQRLWRAVQAKVLARRGEFEQAERLGRKAVELADRSDSHGRADNRLDLAEVLTIARRHDEAAALVSEAISLYEEKGLTAGVDRAKRLAASWEP